MTRLRMKGWRIAAACCALTALSACSGPILSQPGSPHIRLDGFYEYGAAGRDLKMTVVGSPFANVGAADFAKLVEASAQKAAILRPATHLTLTPGENARLSYQVVFAFQPVATQTAQGLCSGQIEHGDGGNSLIGGNGYDLARNDGTTTVRAIAAFCISGLAKTEIVGQTQATGPDDERVQDLISLMTQALFRPDVRDTGGHSGLQLGALPVVSPAPKA